LLILIILIIYILQLRVALAMRTADLNSITKVRQRGPMRLPENEVTYDYVETQFRNKPSNTANIQELYTLPVHDKFELTT
jgi:hypothetical protein